MGKNRLAGAVAIVTTALLLQAAAAAATTAAAAAATTAAAAAATTAAGDASCRAAEYELMSLLIREHYGSEFSLILIGRDTESWCLRQHLGFLQRQWPGLRSETIDSLIVVNSGATRRLAEKFILPVRYRLVAEDEYLRTLRLDQDRSAGGALQAGATLAATGMEAYAAISGALEPDWDNFDRVFPDALGYLTFSRIAFDSACTQALVIFSNAYRCSGILAKPAKRDIAFFGRKDGAWELVGVAQGIKAMD